MAERVLNKEAAAPRPLATPTDLKANEVRAVVEAVNPLIADTLALYVKTKNFHWHVSGPHFRDYHLLFDEQAEQLLESIDVLAERIRKIGGATIRSIGHIASLQSIGDDEEEFVPAEEMVRRLLEDNRAMAKKQRAAIEVCDEQRDTPTGNLLQEVLDQTERRMWFLFETSRIGEPARAEMRPDAETRPAAESERPRGEPARGPAGERGRGDSMERGERPRAERPRAERSPAPAGPAARNRGTAGRSHRR